MGLSDVFGPTFIVSLAICCILVGAVSFLFYNKLQQQSAKISAIMDLTTTLVAEVNVMKNSPPMASMMGGMGGMPPAFIPQETNIHAVKMDIPDVKSSLDPLIEVSEDGDGLSETDDEDDEDVEDVEEMQINNDEDDEEDIDDEEEK